MKSKRKMIYLLLGAVLTVTSCTEDKNLYDPESAVKVTDLQIPDGFDWATTKSIECSITSPVNTTISIYLEESCPGDGLIATLPVSQNSTKINLELPSASNAIYVQYPAATGNKVMKIDLNSVVTKSASKEIILPENAVTVSDNATRYTHSYTPAKDTDGTLMFEDLFPELGDYDLNDLVAYYNTHTYCSSKNNLDGLELKFQIRALGGSLPYRLCLQLSYIPTKYVQGNMTVSSSMPGITMELLPQEGEEKAILVIDGLNQLKGSGGGSFYNTEAGASLSLESELPTITCKIERNNIDDVNGYNAFSSTCANPGTAFNFFLQNPSNMREIHLRGYEPTKLYTNYANEDPRHQDISFYGKSNQVWGIKVPAAIKHAREGVDFTKAYKNFKQWVVSNGNKNLDWYESPEPGAVITLK